MNKARLFSLILLLCCAMCISAQDDVVSRMTNRQKANMLVGSGWSSLFAGFNIPFCKGRVPGAAGETRSFRKLGIRPLVLADGPAGLRLKLGMRSTAFPVGALLASTGDTSLVAEVGSAIADEARYYGIDVVLTPGMNLQVNPMCGRNYEYFSADPYVTAQYATAIVRGVQRRGVAACVKHFACNFEENNRMKVNVELDEQTLRNVYLKAFEQTIHDAQPWTLMSSYNLLNGVRTQESHWLLHKVLREDWGYQGVVMTDWTGVRRSVVQVQAGNDLLMPGMKRQRYQLRRALRRGRLSVETADSAIRRILVLSERTRNSAFTTPIDADSMFRAHAVLARRAAAKGMQFRKNDVGTHVLTPDRRRVALYGSTSYDMLIAGCGSGHANPLYQVNLNQGLRFAGYTPNTDIEEYYHKFLRRPRSHKRSTVYMRRFLGDNGPKEKSVKRSFIVSHEPQTDVAIVTIGRSTGEGRDRTMTKGDYYLSDTELALLQNVSEVYHAAGKRVIVILNVGGEIELQSWSHLADVILMASLPGQEAGSAVVDVLTGSVH